MPYDPQIHHRHSIRLKGYDYTLHGAYFVTICAQNRELLFDPQPVRDMIQRWWDKLPVKFPDVQTDAFVIMPNHIHGIVVLVGVDPCVDPSGPRVDPYGHPEKGQSQGRGQSHGIAPTNPGGITSARGIATTDHENGQSRGVGQSHGIAPTGAVSLAEVVQWFKTMTTNEYIHGVKQMGWTPFAGKFWQRNYYEYIVRDDDDLNRIRAYVLENPRTWQEDQLNPFAPPNRFNP